MAVCFGSVWKQKQWFSCKSFGCLSTLARGCHLMYFSLVSFVQLLAALSALVSDGPPTHTLENVSHKKLFLGLNVKQNQKYRIRMFGSDANHFDFFSYSGENCFPDCWVCRCCCSVFLPFSYLSNPKMCFVNQEEIQPFDDNSPILAIVPKTDNCQMAVKCIPESSSSYSFSYSRKKSGNLGSWLQVICWPKLGKLRQD